MSSERITCVVGEHEEWVRVGVCSGRLKGGVDNVGLFVCGRGFWKPEGEYDIGGELGGQRGSRVPEGEPCT